MDSKKAHICGNPFDSCDADCMDKAHMSETERSNFYQNQMRQWRDAALDAAAERDQLRAQVDVASGNARLYADRCTALEAEVERLRVRGDDFRTDMLAAALDRDAATARAEAAESTAAGLRQALEAADKAIEQVHDEWAEPVSAHDAGAGQAAAICFAASMAIETALDANRGAK